MKQYKIYDYSLSTTDNSIGELVGQYQSIKDAEKGAKSYKKLHPDCDLAVYKYRADLDAYELMLKNGLVFNVLKGV